MKSRRVPARVSVPAALLAFHLLVTALPTLAADKPKPLPFTVPVSGMRLDPTVRNQVSGLALTVEDAGWPSLTMLGHHYGTIGALGKSSDHPNDSWMIGPLRFGVVRMGQGGHLSDQQVNDVTNTLTYLNDRSEALKVTVTRLSPAVLFQADGNALELFGAADSSASDHPSTSPPMCWDPDHQKMTPIPPEQRGPFAPGAFPPAAGDVKPLRWATCRDDGAVVTGVFGGQPALAFPFITWHKRFMPISSLAPQTPSNPPVEGLGRHWLLLWYGSGSPFLSSKVPVVFGCGPGFHVSVPWRLATAFSADVPMLLVFEKSPQSIALRQDGNVSRLMVQYPGPAGKVVMVPLFGHDLQSAAQTEQWLKEFPAEVKARCDQWAERLGDFPVNVNEQTTYDPPADQVTNTDTYEYLSVRPGGQKTALLPPMLALGLQHKLPAVVAPAPADLQYATQFGPLLAVPGDRFAWRVVGLGKLACGTEIIGPSTPQSMLLERELSAAVDKVLAAGHLAPWILPRQAPWVPGFGTTYGKDPSQVLYFMSEFLPLLPPAQQAKVRQYLTSEATAYPPDKIAHVPTNQGAHREFGTIPPNLVGGYDGPLGLGPETDEYYEPVPSIFRAYGMARYYLATGGKPTKAEMEFWQQTMRESLAGRDWATMGWYWGKYATFRPQGDPGYRSSYWQYTPRAVHRDAAGLIGYLRLCQASNASADPQAWGQLSRLMALRFALTRYGAYLLESNLIRMPGTPGSDPYFNAHMWVSSTDQAATPPDPGKQFARSGDFSKPENQFEQVWEVNQHEVTMYSGASLIANGALQDGFEASPDNGNANNQIVFADLTPEVGKILADWGEGDDVARYVKHYAAIQPIWYKSYSDSEHLTEGELGYTPASDSYQYFLAHAWIAATPPEELQRYIDEPWVAVGDFFYMDKLAETIKSYRGVKWQSAKP